MDVVARDELTSYKVHSRCGTDTAGRSDVDTNHSKYFIIAAPLPSRCRTAGGIGIQDHASASRPAELTLPRRQWR